MASICVRGLLEDRLNFPIEDYSAHAEMLKNMEIDDLAKQLRTQAGSASTRQERSTQYQGVRKHSGGTGGKWEAILRVAGRSVYLGMYDSDKEAAQVYDQAAILRWAQGVGATSHADSTATQPTLNFPLETYQDLVVENKDDSASEDALDDDAPVLLGKRYAEAVLQGCRQFHSQSETLKNALA